VLDEAGAVIDRLAGHMKAVGSSLDTKGYAPSLRPPRLFILYPFCRAGSVPAPNIGVSGKLDIAHRRLGAKQILQATAVVVLITRILWVLRMCQNRSLNSFPSALKVAKDLADSSENRRR
jgi:hypothetical protein